MDDNNSAENNVEIWKMKRLIRSLEAARGNGTSMISLIIPPKDQLARINAKLADEYGTATNIKSRVNRLSVLSAITSTQQRLKLYNKAPPNGLVIYCGTVLTDEGKERLVNIDLEPFKPINTSLYLCDNKFHTEALSELLESDQKFGFIIMDGNGSLFGTLCGNTREVIHKLTVDLPKKHGRGGQSALRFARLRTEKRHNYVRKVAEVAVQCYITNDRPNVSGLILAGSADFKTELKQSDMFDQRLQRIVLKTVDVSYGGENGFNQAIELSAECLQGVKFMQEKKLIEKYFDEVAQDTGRVVYGVEQTFKALELGAVETLIVWENTDYQRIELRSNVSSNTNAVNSSNVSKSHFAIADSGDDGVDNGDFSTFENNPIEGNDLNFNRNNDSNSISQSHNQSQSSPIMKNNRVLYLTKEDELKKRFLFMEKDETGNDVESEIVDRTPLIDWFAEHYRDFGATLEIITDKSQEGAQFVRGFGGIGGLLRYKLEIHED